ncbi:DUF3408 domain-containing protein [Sphingobacterium cellulitidis]|uniref:DUF3408 domain-containing protein n=1 Tax=Sphingobacterium cellulitidis TaxID=1768011 RepID=UPI003C799EBD
MVAINRQIDCRNTSYFQKFNARNTKKSWIGNRTKRIDKLTIYAYLDNIIEYHFQEFRELISEIYNDKHKPLF